MAINVTNPTERAVDRKDELECRMVPPTPRNGRRVDKGWFSWNCNRCLRLWGRG